MSKSRGTFITARSYVDHIKNTEYLRYYYAAKLNGTMEDLDLTLRILVAKSEQRPDASTSTSRAVVQVLFSKRFNGKLARSEGL